MFTEQDYQSYFVAIQETEKKMISNIDFILSGISNPRIRNILIGIRNVEFKHLQLEDELFAILEEQKAAI